MSKRKSEKFECAKKMPPLHHTLPNSSFDIAKSEVINWLIEQPDIRQFVFNKAMEGRIAYDPKTRTWQGVDYHV